MKICPLALRWLHSASLSVFHLRGLGLSLKQLRWGGSWVHLYGFLSIPGAGAGCLQVPAHNEHLLPSASRQGQGCSCIVGNPAWQRWMMHDQRWMSQVRCLSVMIWKSYPLGQKTNRLASLTELNLFWEWSQLLEAWNVSLGNVAVWLWPSFGQWWHRVECIYFSVNVFCQLWT